MTGDRVHTAVALTDVRAGDVVVFETGVTYAVERRVASTVHFEGGFSIDYPEDATLVVWRTN